MQNRDGAYATAAGVNRLRDLRAYAEASTARQAPNNPRTPGLGLSVDRGVRAPGQKRASGELLPRRELLGRQPKPPVRDLGRIRTPPLPESAGLLRGFADPRSSDEYAASLNRPADDEPVDARWAAAKPEDDVRNVAHLSACRVNQWQARQPRDIQSSLVHQVILSPSVGRGRA